MRSETQFKFLREFKKCGERKIMRIGPITRFPGVSGKRVISGMTWRLQNREPATRRESGEDRQPENIKRSYDRV
jgi:hypothetical protein